MSLTADGKITWTQANMGIYLLGRSLWIPRALRGTTETHFMVGGLVLAGCAGGVQSQLLQRADQEELDPYPTASGHTATSV